MCLKAGIPFFEVISKCPIHNFSLINAKSSWISLKLVYENLRSKVTVKFMQENELEKLLDNSYDGGVN